jgi:hypothetical protein
VTAPRNRNDLASTLFREFDFGGTGRIVTGMNFTVKGRAYGDPKVDEENRLLERSTLRPRPRKLVIVSSTSMTLATIGGTYWN